MDGNRNGLFTGKLRRVGNKGRFRGGRRRFHDPIASPMPPNRSPNGYRAGAPHRAFEQQKPFTI
jgi:hypothetical protein